MSKGWVGGSTTAWRKLRLEILARDGWRCKIALPGEWSVRTRDGRTVIRRCLGRADCVHHKRGKAAGDDPRYLAAACTPCNLKVGDPTIRPDPAPRPRTNWSDHGDS